MRGIGTRRSVSVAELEQIKFSVIPLEGEWREAIGQPERNATIFIYGPPKNGKTYASLSLAKALLPFFQKIAYNPLEMGISLSLRQAIDRTMFDPAQAKKIMLLNREKPDQLIARMSKKKAPGVIITDSLQYSGMNYRQYSDFKEQTVGKMKIWLSHADGKKPKGEVARSVQYDADVIIYVEGFTATCEGRYGGGGAVTIWPEGAQRFN